MMATDTVGLMDTLGIEGADVVGISTGGRIALEIAIAHPERVGRLVLVSTSADGTGRLSMSWPMRMLMPLQRFQVFQGRYPQPRYAHARQREASATYRAGWRLDRVLAPTLIAHGRRDRSTPIEAARRMHTGIQGSRMEVFRGGHMFFLLVERERFLDAIDGFLST
jgi:pimeloyl-ACP methyl ester carboxylesterase